jgi:hypothetical protein
MLSGAKQNNLLKLVVVALIVACLLVIPLSGCQSTPSGQIEVRVIVTQNFNSTLMLDKLVTLDDDSTAMDALQRVATVETKYGGGFVVAINGVRSQYPEANKDWFLYINDTLMNVGAAAYILNDGDVEHWDFHQW